MYSFPVGEQRVVGSVCAKKKCLRISTVWVCPWCGISLPIPNLVRCSPSINQTLNTFKHTFIVCVRINGETARVEIGTNRLFSSLSLLPLVVVGFLLLRLASRSLRLDAAVISPLPSLVHSSVRWLVHSLVCNRWCDVIWCVAGRSPVTTRRSPVHFYFAFHIQRKIRIHRVHCSGQRSSTRAIYSR